MSGKGAKHGRGLHPERRYRHLRANDDAGPRQDRNSKTASQAFEAGFRKYAEGYRDAEEAFRAWQAEAGH